MGRKIEDLAKEVESLVIYHWTCPVCLSYKRQYGGKKIGFIIALMKQHGVKKVEGKLVCGQCASTQTDSNKA